MQPTNERIAELLLKSLKQQASEEELAELETWRGGSSEHAVLIDRLSREGFIAQGLRELEQARQRSSARLANQNVILADRDGGASSDIRDGDRAAVVPTVHRVHFLKTGWFRYAAAVVLIAGSAIWYMVQHRPVRNEQPSLVESIRQAGADVPPGGDKAVLTLADGRQIVLDNAPNGNLAQQGTTKIIKLENGQLAYKAGAASTKDILYNTISTPRGGQYQMVLPDGSRVWLNAASSIKFPTAFAGNVRNVEITGEAYMEVAKNVKAPFTVRANDMSIAVLGTSFNINAYTDEAEATTTLVEGSVNVKSLGKEALLKPGQQAQVMQQAGAAKQQAGAAKQPLQVVNDVDIEKVVAWKNGLFDFNGAGVGEVMRQLSRWYDIEVAYEKGIPTIEFAGKMSKNVSLVNVLKGLEGAGMRFRLEGKKLIIFP